MEIVKPQKNTKKKKKTQTKQSLQQPQNYLTAIINNKEKSGEKRKYFSWMLSNFG